MVRAAAKNYKDVTIITSSEHYDELISEMNKYKGATSEDFRKKMSRLAFTETAYYDSLIANYFNEVSKVDFPKKKILTLPLNHLQNFNAKLIKILNF